jgi:hypothetical protein
LVNNSLRFRASASAYLSRTPATAGNRQTWTWSGWVKRSRTGQNDPLFDASNNASTTTYGIRFENTDVLQVIGYVSGFNYNLETTQVFRDPSAWYHIIVAFDDTQATASNRIKVYVNGSQVTSFTTATYPAQNTNYLINDTVQHRIGSAQFSSQYFDGYLTEINLIDGQALTPNSFGTINSYGVWQPITYGGSYGTNGFYLPFNSQAVSFVGSFTTSQYLSVANNSAFQYGTGDFTVECYFNPTTLTGTPGNSQSIVGLWGGSTGQASWLLYLSAGNLIWYTSTNGSAQTNSLSGASGMVIGKWYHLALVRSSGTTSIYVNGSLIASTSSVVNLFNANSTLTIGYNPIGGTPDYVNGYLSNVRIVKGTALYTANFIPPTSALTNVSGTSLLTLQNSSIVDNSANAFLITNNGGVSTGQTYPFAYGIFNDQGPAGNNWTPNNISGAFGSTLDYMTDVPTLTSATAANFCTLNPLDNGNSNILLTNGNLSVSSSTTWDRGVKATVGISSGKWYYEYTHGTVNAGTNPAADIGWTKYTSLVNSYSNGGGGSSDTYLVQGSNGNKNNGGTNTSYGSAFTTGDIEMCALDLDNGKMYWGKNGTWFASGDPAAGTNAAYTGLSGTFFPLWYWGLSPGTSGVLISNINFGQRPFTYTPPSGFVALNTFNL